MKIVTIVGARPQFIKAAAVSRVLRRSPNLQEILIHTGQHYDENMSDVFFEELEIPEPDYYLGIGSGSHGFQTGRMLEAVERTLLEAHPDGVLVYGDTNSTLAGALASVKLHIPVAHVEAGLRSFNRLMPEEINRLLTDHASDLLYVPTEGALKNLVREGIPQERIHLVGDVMYDAALFYRTKADKTSGVLHRLGLPGKDFVLATVHRAENTDDATNLSNIFTGLEKVANELPVVVPLHPRTRNALERIGLPKSRSMILLIEPLGYLDMVMLEKHAQLIVTDSGGVQKEAFFYGVPCVTLRNETEWTELVDLGWNCLVPPHKEGMIYEGIKSMLGRTGTSAHPYGDGNAAVKIVSSLETNLLRKSQSRERAADAPRLP